MYASTVWNGLRGAMTAALCALFLLLAMGTALLSSSVYRQTAQAGQDNSLQRTALSYLANQIRRGDGAGLQAGYFGGAGALVIPEGEYLTVIYCYDGALRELYTARGSGLGPADGVAILALDSLEIGVEGPLLTLTVRSGQAEHRLCLAPRGGVAQIGEVSL